MRGRQAGLAGDSQNILQEAKEEANSATEPLVAGVHTSPATLISVFVGSADPRKAAAMTRVNLKSLIAAIRILYVELSHLRKKGV